MAIAAALLACAISANHMTDVHPKTMERIILGESGGDPYAIRVNGYGGHQPHPTTKEEAISIATRFILAGYKVDLGLSQIDSVNLGSLGYTVEDAFDECKNVAGGGMILTSFYRSAIGRFGEGQVALGAAISAYNTGSFWRGWRNGYVARIEGIPDVPFDIQVARSPPSPSVPNHPTIRLPPDPYRADTVAYTREAPNIRVD